MSLSRKWFLVVLSVIFGVGNTIFAQKIEAKNLVPNADFEEMGVGWTNQAMKDGKTVKVEIGGWVTDELHSGKYSLQVINADPNLRADWASDYFSCEAGEKIQYSYWLKTFSLKKCEGGYFEVRLSVYDKDKNRLKAYGKYPGYGAISPKELAELLEAVKSDWIEYKAEITLPAETKYVNISLLMANFTGVVWLDDVEVINLP
ncbi:MAG: hypothetical protein AABY84_04175 [Candidatus Firestonebacteria bacterium]